MTRYWDPSSTRNKIVRVTVGLAASCLVSQVFASGFQLNEQNVTNLGLAYSGTAALAEDVSTNFYNAAGLVYLGESQVVLSGILIQGDFDFTATRSLSSLGFPVSGSNTDDPAKLTGVPAFHIAKRLDGRWVFGFSVSSPFGLLTKYSDEGIARYIATESSLKTLNFSPSIAWQALPTLSLGVGVDALYGKAKLDSNIGGGLPGSLDGFLHNDADGWGYGWHIGMLWEPIETTRVGISYRSTISLRVEGTADLVTPSPVGPFTAPVGIVNLLDVHSRVWLPETATFSIYQEVLPCLAFTGDIAWTNWHRFDTLRLRYHPIGIATDLNIDENFKDTMRYALGAIYKYREQWTFRAGVSWDESPTSDRFRTAAIPDSDRFWAALGAGYTLNDNWHFDAGYAHIFFKDASIDQFAPFNAGTGARASAARLTGDFDSYANLFGIQLRYDFV